MSNTPMKATTMVIISYTDSLSLRNIQAAMADHIGMVKKITQAVDTGRYFTEPNIPWMQRKPTKALTTMIL